jgi:uncharacterized protein YqjF (DUF2071 family)
MSPVSGNALISCAWRDVLITTWTVDAALLAPYLPAGTTLDLWNSRGLLSIVGVRFLDLRVAGLAMPFHQEFEQINFRFYVRREAKEDRRGVVFLKQIVPSSSMSLIATLLYNESFLTTATRHEITRVEEGWTLYEWMVGGRWNRISATRHGAPVMPGSDSIETFIKDRPCAYTRQADGSTVEFEVQHPAWPIYATEEMMLDCDVAPLIGAPFVPVLSAQPVSTFVAAGSEVTLHPDGRSRRTRGR